MFYGLQYFKLTLLATFALRFIEKFGHTKAESNHRDAYDAARSAQFLV